jgi:hypothetical protein
MRVERTHSALGSFQVLGKICAAVPSKEATLKREQWKRYARQTAGLGVTEHHMRNRASVPKRAHASGGVCSGC